MEKHDLMEILRGFLEEETTLIDNQISSRWQGGKLVFIPHDETLQDKELDIDTFLGKIIRVRDNLRVLEQRINSHKTLSNDEKLNITAYISKSYGTLTTFNVFFKDKKNHFVGAGSAQGTNPKSKLSLAQMEKKLGLNEY